MSDKYERQCEKRADYRAEYGDDAQNKQYKEYKRVERNIYYSAHKENNRAYIQRAENSCG